MEQADSRYPFSILRSTTSEPTHGWAFTRIARPVMRLLRAAARAGRHARVRSMSDQWLRQYQVDVDKHRAAR